MKRSKSLRVIASLFFIQAAFLFAPCTPDAEAAAPATAVLGYPANGATGITSPLVFQWSSITGAQAYYLYVGTTQGAKDLVNTGEKQVTAYYVPGLPSNRTLYARMWTKQNGIWYYNDSTFTTAQNCSALTYPLSGATGIRSQITFQWTATAGAQAYYLYVGTTPGAKDLVDTGEVLTTNRYFAGLPANKTLYARMWTKINGVWYYNDTVFSTGSSYAAFVYPQDGTAGLKNAITFRWTAASGAQAYYLYVGSTPGAKDVHDSGEIMTTTRYVVGLPGGATLYARIWTRINGIWYYNDETISTSPQASAAFIYPLGGSVGVDTTLPLQWTSIPNAQAYYLYVGSAPGAKDLHDSGEIMATSHYVAGLPTGRTIYARIYTKLAGTWYYNDISFTAGKQLPFATFTYPADGATDVKLSTPFQWTLYSNIQGFELVLGTTPGGQDLYDSGLITKQAQYFVGYPALPRQTWIYGRIWSEIDGSWYSSDVKFMMDSPAPVPASEQTPTALQLTAQVRAMADSVNKPYDGTLLSRYLASLGRQAALCSDYAAVLTLMLYDNYVGDARLIWTAFDTDRYDSHTMVEFFNQNQQSWMVLDPTFAVTPRRSSDGQYATAEDVQNSTFDFDWSSITYDFLTTGTKAALQTYYLDYPLLYLNLCRADAPCTNGEGNSPIPYMNQVQLPYNSGSSSIFALAREGGGSCAAVVNGKTRSFQCDGIDYLSPCFSASSIAPSTDSQSATAAYVAKRYVFPFPLGVDPALLRTNSDRAEQ